MKKYIEDGLKIVPTHVGVSPLLGDADQADDNCPHACGGEPGKRK